jgi:hypothetical protein
VSYGIGVLGTAVLYQYDGQTLIRHFSRSSTFARDGAGNEKTLGEAVSDAIAAANYVIVTNPSRLDSTYTNQADIKRLLSTMAELASLKQGVLGFVETYHFEILDTLLETGWAPRLHPDFNSDQTKGYVLLVGETEIIPSWREDSFDLTWSNSDEHTTFVADSDLPYASIRGKDKSPELALGRIIGNSPAALIKPIETSIAVWKGLPGYSFDRSDALIVSGRGAGVTSDFIPTVNIIEDVLQADGTTVTKIHWRYTDPVDYTKVFTMATPGKDIVFFRGHGNIGVWGEGLNTGMVGVWPLDFDGANPFALGTTCLSGGYEPNANSMPEAFFESGAGAFVGATQVSATSANTPAGKWFFRNWETYETAGKVLTDLKRKFVSDDAYWRLWSYEYNFYGDPKYGVRDPGLAAAAAPTVAPAAVPSPTIQVHVPGYEVTNVEGWDYVEIPDGKMVAEQDQYGIPYWVVSVDYPAGLRPQAVTMTLRSGLSITTGLQLTTTQMVTSEVSSMTTSAMGTASAPAALPAPGWYPALDQKFSWTVEDNGTGTSKLLITIYPFYYDSAEDRVVFYQDYEFDIQTISSNAQVDLLKLNKDSYGQGDTAIVDVHVGNAGAVQDVVVVAEIRSAISDTLVAGLPLRVMEGLTGTAQLRLDWNTSGVAAGAYYVQVSLRDAEGNLLDSDARDFLIKRQTIFLPLVTRQ